MNIELRIELLKNRMATLETNGKENSKVVNKIRRLIRNLEKRVVIE